MAFYVAKTLSMSFDRALEKLRAELNKEGFGIISDLDVKENLKEKLDVTFRRYRILVAWNPTIAHRTLLLEDKAGLVLPCNLIVQDRGDHVTEVAAIDPRSTMGAVGNAGLEDAAKQVGMKLEAVIGHV